MCAYRKAILTIGMQLHVMSLRTIWSISFPFGFINKCQSGIDFFYPPTKSEGYSFGVVRPSVHTFCLSGTISQYIFVRFDSFLVQMISIMNSRYPISLVKIDPLTLELLPLFKYRQL